MKAWLNMYLKGLIQLVKSELDSVSSAQHFPSMVS